MKEIDNDKLLNSFFAESKREIPDNGFSNRVMQRLPGRSYRMARLWTKAVMLVGALLFILLGGFSAMWDTMKEAVAHLVNNGAAATIDLKTVVIVAIVLMVLATKKVASLA